MIKNNWFYTILNVNNFWDKFETKKLKKSCIIVMSQNRINKGVKKMPKDIHMLVSMINMKLRDDDMQLSHVLSIYDLDENDFMKRLAENDYYYDESTNQIKTK